MTTTIIREFAEKFRTTYKDSTGNDLPYSESSVALLDEVVDRVFPLLDPAVVPQIAEYMGAFLGELMVETLGMTWTVRKEDGQWVVSTKTRDGDDVTSNPWNKVAKRIQNGSEDNLAYYYAMVRKIIHEGMPRR